jgi:outer membrane protein OmpA-like peptidoglycan-associated protein
MRTGFSFFILMVAVSLTGVAAQETYYFSPGTDSPKKELVVPLSISDSRYIKAWKFVVIDDSNKVVLTKGEELPPIVERPENWKEILGAFFKPKKSVKVLPYVTWDGKNNSGALCRDGVYFFYFTASDDNDNYGESARYRVILDTTRPKVTITPPGQLIFGDTQRPSLNIREAGSREDLWTAEIKNEAGKIVRKFTWRDMEPQSFAWDGKDDKGMSLPDGLYNYSVSAVDAAGNKSLPAELANIRLESITPEAEAGRAVAEFAPNGKTREQQFTIRASLTKGIESWNFSVVGTDGKVVREWARTGDSLPSRLDWNGRDANGTIAEGSFHGILTIKYTKGNVIKSETPSFLCTGHGPDVKVRTTPALFSPDGDGENDALTLHLTAQTVLPITTWTLNIDDPNGKPFKTWSGKSEVPATLTWNGKGDNGDLVESAMDYPFTFDVVDSQEQAASTNGRISVDVLVLREGDRYILRVPAIIFRANNADFAGKSEDRRRGLDQSVIDNNTRVLKRIAEILQKFNSYRVRIEGHANTETGTEKEEVEQLVPLSKARAEFVKKWLVDNGGVSAARLTTEGVGGRRPVMQNRRDKESWWKNRRVEFILQR